MNGEVEIKKLCLTLDTDRYLTFMMKRLASQTLKFTYQHCFHIDSITSNDSIESMPIKHRVAVTNAYYYWKA